MKIVIIFVISILALGSVTGKSSIKPEGNRVVMSGVVYSHSVYPYNIHSDEELEFVIESLTGLVFSEVWVDKWDPNSWPAVIQTVLTRVYSERFPNMITNVIYQRNEARPGEIKCQYDGVCKDLFHNVPENAYEEIKSVVIAVLTDQIADPCPGAAFYYNPDIIKTPPEWAKPENFVCKAGSHLFYSEGG